MSTPVYKNLTTLWLPLLEMKDDWTYKDDETFNLLINQLGFIYIEYNSTLPDKVYDRLYTFLEEKGTSKDSNDNTSIKIIKDTFFNKNLTDILNPDNISAKEQFINFFKSIQFDFKTEENKIDLNFIQYSLYGENKENIFLHKLAIDNHQIINNIINRNFEKLLQKSILYTNGMKFDKNEIYELGYISNIEFPNLNNISIYTNNQQIKSETKEIIIKNIFHKALQDSIEELTIYKFLEQTQDNYLRRILKKLDVVNQSLLYLNSTILHIDETTNVKNNLIMSEDEIEIYAHHLMYITPLFRVIESKIKEAYYIRVGNTTTETNMSNDELIEQTLVYVKWKMAIDYFENLSNRIHNTLNVYHQNRNIKELEHISYYESYKADLEDMKNINKLKPLEELQQKHKKDFTKVALLVSLAILSTNTTFIDKSFFKKLDFLQPFIQWIKTYDSFHLIVPFFSEIIPMVFRIIILYLFIITLIKITTFITQKFESIRLKYKAKSKYFEFEIDDYDKHEHQSKQPIYKSYKGNKEILSLEYNDNLSAYTLIKKLQDSTMENTQDSTVDNIKLFPELIHNNNYGKLLKYKYRENYRLLRSDKTTVKLLFRYRINNLKISDFIDFVEKDSIYSKNDFNDENIQELKHHSGIELDLYIVYSFDLKKKIHFQEKKKNNNYTYEVYKNQFRVHYHLNMLPIENIAIYQEIVAELIHTYFFKRLKVYDNDKVVVS